MKSIRLPQSTESAITGYYQPGLHPKSWGFLIAAVCLLALGGCKKEQETPNEIFGQWQWISDVGGITGKGEYTPANTKIERTYQFNRDSTFVECYNSQCTDPVKFTSRMEKSILDGQQRLVVTIPRRFYLAPPDTGYTILIFRYSVAEMGDKLRLQHDAFDGFEESYSRK